MRREVFARVIMVVWPRGHWECENLRSCGCVLLTQGFERSEEDTLAVQTSHSFFGAAASTHIRMWERYTRESRVGTSDSAFQYYCLFGIRAAAGAEPAVSMAA